eukprot:TRINITY_DN1633_c0_g1_i2.p1 TRINITY_DN1633_c0_g1~~TRINITY_DN1633_c0_g1_i2.p1  ORF type:complete len:455 (-),score=24.44 TRINITY_DN1633_c0_g1_i2:324-1688(-)
MTIPLMTEDAFQCFQRELEALDEYGRYSLLHIVETHSHITLAALDRWTGRRVALRRIGCDMVLDADVAWQLINELALLSSVHHRNLVGVYDALVAPDTVSCAAYQPPDTFLVYVVVDYMETDLRRVLRSQNPLTEAHIQLFVHQILCALECLHRAGVAHCHLDPSCVALNANCELRVTNIQFDDREQPLLWYVPPEAVVLGGSAVGPARDIWACGCIMGEMFNHRCPVFPGKDRISQLNTIVDIIGTPSDEDMSGIPTPSARNYLQRRPRERVHFPQRFRTPSGGPLPVEASELLEAFLAFCPEKRPSAKKALEYEYMRDLPAPNLNITVPRFHRFSRDLHEGNAIHFEAVRGKVLAFAMCVSRRSLRLPGEHGWLQTVTLCLWHRALPLSHKAIVLISSLAKNVHSVAVNAMFQNCRAVRTWLLVQTRAHESLPQELLALVVQFCHLPRSLVS